MPSDAAGRRSEVSRVAVAGASGLIGTALLRELSGHGIETIQLVRRPATDPGQRQWNPERRWIDGPGLSDVDAVIGLSGAGIGARPWTARRKAVLRSSRVDPTSTIVEALAGAPRCHTFLSGSAVGFYGNAGNVELTEQSPQGTGFLARLVGEWEAAASAAPAGVRVVHLRTGLVMDANGGLLGMLRPIFATGAGGRLGDGRQWMPWITLADHVRAQHQLLFSELQGPVNLSAPHPVTNAEFTKALAAALNRPALIPTPLTPMRLVMGPQLVEELLLASQRALPTKLLGDGFSFEQTNFGPAVRAAVGATTG